jgi:trehalose/maltose hydrolase-like predicted phosphorylase
MFSEISNFWVSRSVKNRDGSYSIINAIGANEFAPNVNDNAFTNGSAKTVLMFANDTG